MVKVSVIIPVYNAEKYLMDCMESLTTQTLNEIEIICVDDASEDGCKNIIENCQQICPNIKYFRLSENHGQAYARNRGIEQASGKYVYFLDSDDKLKSVEALERLYGAAEEAGADCVCFDSEIVYETDDLKPMLGGREKLFERIDAGTYTGGDYTCEFFANPEYSVGVWRQFWRRNFLVNKGISFHEDTSPHEDLLFTFEAFFLAEKILYLPETLHIYRFRNNSSSSDSFSVKRFRAYQKIYMESIRFLEMNSDAPLSVKMQKALNNYISASLMPLYTNYAFLSAKDSGVLNRTKQQELKIDEWYADLLVMQRFPMLERLFTSDEVKKLKDAEKIVVYGAGVYSLQLQQMLREYGFEDFIVAVTKNKGKGRIVEISDLKQASSESVVILAVSNLWREEMRAILRDCGFKNIIELKD